MPNISKPALGMIIFSIIVAALVVLAIFPFDAKDKRPQVISLREKLHWQIIDSSTQQLPTDYGLFSSTGGQPYEATVSVTNLQNQPITVNVLTYQDLCRTSSVGGVKPFPHCGDIYRETVGATKASLGPEETRNIKVVGWPRTAAAFEAPVKVGVGFEGVEGVDESGDPRDLLPR